MGKAARHLADLHVHTTASDGTLTPEQTVREADRLGLAAVGIADHDTIAGVAPALASSVGTGVLVVPAVEINTDYENDEVHLLGYYIDHESSALGAHLERLRQARMERAARIVERLNQLGLNVTLDRVKAIAGKGAIGRPHIARAIVEAGGASTLNGAFGKYLVRGAPAFVERHKLTPFQAVGMIHEARGVAVLAHPGISKHDELIPELVRSDMQGIEVFHSDHSASQTQHYMEIARRCGLVPTGGSDSHGPYNMKTIPIGHVTVVMAVVHQLKALAEARRSRRDRPS